VPEPLSGRLSSDASLDEAADELRIRQPERGGDPVQVAALLVIESNGQ
jgi:hypothetical protein